MSEQIRDKTEGHDFHVGELVQLRKDLPERIYRALSSHFALGQHYRVYRLGTGNAIGIMHAGPADLHPREIMAYAFPESLSDEKYKDVLPVGVTYFERVPN